MFRETYRRTYTKHDIATRGHDQREGEHMNIMELCKELHTSRATLYRRAQQSGITINRNEHGDLTPETVAALGNLFDAISVAGMAADQVENLEAVVDQASEDTAGTTSSTNTDTESPSAMLDRLRELENECSRLTLERDAARREAEIWRDQAKQWQDQATRSDARFDRLLQSGTGSENQSPTFAERLRGLFSRRGK